MPGSASMYCIGAEYNETEATATDSPSGGWYTITRSEYVGNVSGTTYTYSIIEGTDAEYVSVVPSRRKASTGPN